MEEMKKETDSYPLNDRVDVPSVEINESFRHSRSCLRHLSNAVYMSKNGHIQCAAVVAYGSVVPDCQSVRASL